MLQHSSVSSRANMDKIILYTKDDDMFACIPTTEDDLKKKVDLTGFKREEFYGPISLWSNVKHDIVARYVD